MISFIVLLPSSRLFGSNPVVQSHTTCKKLHIIAQSLEGQAPEASRIAWPAPTPFCYQSGEGEDLGL